MKRCSSGCAAAKPEVAQDQAQARGEVDALETGEARAERLAEQRESGRPQRARAPPSW
jgi:hypothetical protein